MLVNACTELSVFKNHSTMSENLIYLKFEEGKKRFKCFRETIYITATD